MDTPNQTPDDYDRNTRVYNRLKTRGWIIRRVGDGSWMLSNGLRTVSGFHTWIAALWAALELDGRS